MEFTLSECRNLCRICLEEGADVSLFEDDEDMKLYVKVMACSTVQITEKDGYPSSICPLCYSMLDTAYKFKIKCEDTDVKLRSCITKHNVKVEYEEPTSDIMDTDFDMEDPQDFDCFLDMNMKEETVVADTVEPLVLEKNCTKGKSKKKKSKWKIAKSGKLIRLKLERKSQLHEACFKMKAKKFKQIESGKIASSLLEGKCSWNGFNWRFISQPVDSQEELKTKKEADSIRKLMQQERIEKSKKREKRIKEIITKKQTILCDLCGRVFNSRNHMKVHHKLVHQKLTNSYKCPYPKCDKAFKLSDYLARHYKRCHGEKKDFICNNCGKQFAFISSLRKHMKVHSGEIDWRFCPHCPQKYKTQKSVDIHIKSAHTGERPHVCTLCDSAFFHHDYLKEHMRLHTGETPFKCPICKRGYAQLGNMKSHMKQHRMSELDDQLKTTMKPNYLKLLRDC